MKIDFKDISEFYIKFLGGWKYRWNKGTLQFKHPKFKFYTTSFYYNTEKRHLLRFFNAD